MAPEEMSEHAIENKIREIMHDMIEVSQKRWDDELGEFDRIKKEMAQIQKLSNKFAKLNAEIPSIYK